MKKVIELEQVANSKIRLLRAKKPAIMRVASNLAGVWLPDCCTLNIRTKGGEAITFFLSELESIEFVADEEQYLEETGSIKTKHSS